MNRLGVGTMLNFPLLFENPVTVLSDFALPKIFTSATAIIIYLFIILSLISVLVVAIIVELCALHLGSVT